MQGLGMDNEIMQRLLKRRPADAFFADAFEYYKGKTVLVTGGGGSIGGEICSLVARCEPEKLVIFDMYENCAFELWQELKYLYGDRLSVEVEIGSVQDESCIERLFLRHGFDVVFHAAAHKHVPFMESCCAEAVKNNVFGTARLCDAAERHGCKRFIFISTDKAINPVSVMGATKRFGEMDLQSRRDSKTVFSSVRFGNVFASAGSVIPLFVRQIERGGPVTLTDRRMERYFMTPAEAAGLVMEAGVLAAGGELFVLDMGEPVNMYELLCDLIRYMGKEPEKDIEIKETGARPGERLFEEILVGDDLVRCEKNGLIYIEREKPLSREEIKNKLAFLESAVATEDNEKVKLALRAAVPTYKG